MAEGKTTTIDVAIALSGDKEYKSSLAQITRGVNVLASDLKATTAAFSGQKLSMDQLTTKSEKLTAVYKAQAEKVDLMTAKLEEMKSSGEASDDEIARFTIQLNKAKEQLNKTGAELDRTNAAMEDAEDAGEGAADAIGETGDAAEDAGKKTGGLGDKLKGLASGGAAVAKAALAATAAAAAAMGAAIAAAAKEAYQMAQAAAGYADELLTTSTVTGVSTDTLQEWGLAARLVDTDVETMTGGMTRITKAMGEAAGGSKSAKEKFKKLGISITDSNGELRSSEDVFMDAIDALGNIENETERDALAMELFGKSAKELNPLIKAGSKGLKGVSDEAHRLGGVLSEEALAAMGDFDDSIQKMQYAGEGLKNVIGATVMPIFQPFVDLATDSMAEVSNALSDGLQPGELGDIIKKLLPKAKAAIKDLLNTLKDMLPELIGAVTELIGGIAEMLPDLLDVLIPAALSCQSPVSSCSA